MNRNKTLTLNPKKLVGKAISSIKLKPVAAIESAPVAPIETAPAASIETAPTAPIETAPAKSIETPPVAPIETAPAASIETAPTAPIETAPAKSIENAPTAPIETTPATSIENAHTAPIDNEKNSQRSHKYDDIPSYRSPLGKWKAQYEATAGVRHLNSNPPVPCQDAALSKANPKPFVIIADGAGSSPMSDVGAQAVVTAISLLLGTLEQDVNDLLDHKNAPSPDRHRRFSLMLVKHAMGVLSDLASTHNRSVRDFRCTLLLGIIGREHLLWVKVGDGALVQEKIREFPDGSLTSEFLTLGEVGKGEFANETIFVDERLKPSEVQSGLLPSKDVSGLVAMSDGSALALVSFDGLRVAPRISSWLSNLRLGNLSKSTLTSSFYENEFSKKAMGDDCSIALISSEIR